MAQAGFVRVAPASSEHAEGANVVRVTVRTLFGRRPIVESSSPHGQTLWILPAQGALSTASYHLRLCPVPVTASVWSFFHPCKPYVRRVLCAGAGCWCWVLCLKCTRQGHNDAINGLAFALDADGVHFQLATACDDNTVRLFKLTGELGAKSFHIIRINLELQRATAVSFGRNASEVIVASSGAAGGARLAKYHVPDAPGKSPELKWQVSDII